MGCFIYYRNISKTFIGLASVLISTSSSRYILGKNMGILRDLMKYFSICKVRKYVSCLPLLHQTFFPESVLRRIGLRLIYKEDDICLLVPHSLFYIPYLKKEEI